MDIRERFRAIDRAVEVAQVLTLGFVLLAGLVMCLACAATLGGGRPSTILTYLLVFAAVPPISLYVAARNLSAGRSWAAVVLMVLGAGVAAPGAFVLVTLLRLVWRRASPGCEECIAGVVGLVLTLGGTALIVRSAQAMSAIARHRQDQGPLGFEPILPGPAFGGYPGDERPTIPSSAVADPVEPTTPPPTEPKP